MENQLSTPRKSVTLNRSEFELIAKMAAVAQRAIAYQHGQEAVFQATVTMLSESLFTSITTDEQRQGAWIVLDWLDQHLIPDEARPL